MLTPTLNATAANKSNTFEIIALQFQSGIDFAAQETAMQKPAGHHAMPFPALENGTNMEQVPGHERRIGQGDQAGNHVASDQQGRHWGVEKLFHVTALVYPAQPCTGFFPSHQTAIQIRAAIPEKAPGRAFAIDLIQVETRRDDAFLCAPQLGHDFADLIADKAGAIE